MCTHIAVPHVYSCLHVRGCGRKTRILTVRWPVRPWHLVYHLQFYLMLRSISKPFSADIGTTVLCAHPAGITELLCHGRTSRKMLKNSHYCLHLVLLLFGFRNLVEGQESTNISDYPFRNVSLPWNERVADLVQRLTVEEIRDQMAYGGSVCECLSIFHLSIVTQINTHFITLWK